MNATNKLHIIYLYSIKEQMQQTLGVLDGEKPVLIDALKQQLGILVDTIKLFNDIPINPAPKPEISDKPELKVV